MLFVDLDKLKIIKEYHWQNYAVETTLDTTMPAAKMLAELKVVCGRLFEETPAIAASYHIEINAAAQTEMTPEDFAGLVNIAVVAFFNAFIAEGGRHRERRLDIPEKLQCAHVSASLLKRAVNTKTRADVFNLSISCGDYHYILVDTTERISEDEVAESVIDVEAKEAANA